MDEVKSTYESWWRGDLWRGEAGEALARASNLGCIIIDIYSIRRFFLTTQPFTTMSTSAARKKLVVCGGNGFLGSRICKAAVARDWDVTSIRYRLPPLFD